MVCNLLLGQISRSEDYVSFSQVLKNSLSVEKTTPAFCENCKKFTPTNQYARVTKLPEIISVNCGLTNEKEISFLNRQINRNGASKSTETKSETLTNNATTSKPCRYGINCSRFDCHFAHSNRKSPSDALNNTSSSSATPATSTVTPTSTPTATNTNGNGNTSIYQPWFPHDLKLSIDATTGNLNVASSCDENNPTILDNLDAHSSIDSEDIPSFVPSETIKEEKAYKLTAIVCQITNGNQQSLVALIYVDSNYHKAKINGFDGNAGQWYIFNDFRYA